MQALGAQANSKDTFLSCCFLLPANHSISLHCQCADRLLSSFKSKREFCLVTERVESYVSHLTLSIKHCSKLCLTKYYFRQKFLLGSSI